MKKETLTVETDEHGTAIYRNASGKPHNPHGPAVGGTDGSKQYWLKGKRLTETGFKAWQAQQSAPLHNKIATIHGIKYKLTAI